MALSGSNNGGGGTGGSYLRLDWSATQDYGANTSTINANLYLVLQGGTSIVATEVGDINIDGVASGFSRGTTSRGTNSTSLIHSFSRTLSHNADGTRSFSLGGYFDSGWSGFPTISVGMNGWTLDTIPRYPDFTSITVTNVTDQAATINWSTGSTMSSWQYSVDNGANWTAGSTTNVSSGSVTVNNLRSDYAYTAKIRAVRQSSGLTGDSGTAGFTTSSQNNFMDFFDTV